MTDKTSAPILIVEDNQVNAMILRAMLMKHGWTPLIARDGVEGVEMALAHRPALVLMDLQMPRLDGFAAAAEVQRRLRREAPAIIAVTATIGSQVRTACMAAGFADVLSKPVSMDDLIATVRRYVGMG